MRLIATGTLKAFWRVHPDSQEQLKAWHRMVRSASWKTPHDVKSQFGAAGVIGDNRVVFNIAGNKYRLVVKIHYNTGIVYVRFVGTHAEYDAVDATEV